MADRKSMTLQALRALARKVLGSGYSKLEKQELARAIEVAQRKQAAPAKAAAKVSAKAGAKAGAKVSAKPSAGRPAAPRSAPAQAPARRGTPAKVPAPARSPASKARAAGKAVRRAAAAVRARAGQVAAGAGKSAARAGKAAGKAASEKASGLARKARALARGLAARPASRARPGDQPDPESYFVARVRGEEAVRDAPHPMTEAAVEAKRGARRRPPVEPVEAWDEQLGELPWSYGEDLLVALPRDPRTLFLYWDHAGETLKRGWEGLDRGKAELWIFAQQPGGGWERVRAVELALEARGWYVHDLDPGRAYRAEIHLVDRRQDKLLSRPSNPAHLPPVGPSPVVDDRFARIPWGAPISGLAVAAGEGRPGAPYSEELRAQLARLSDWSRFGGGTWGAAAGGMGGRPSSPSSAPGGDDRPSSPAPGSPSSPWGGGR